MGGRVNCRWFPSRDLNLLGWRGGEGPWRKAIASALPLPLAHSLEDFPAGQIYSLINQVNSLFRCLGNSAPSH